MARQRTPDCMSLSNVKSSLAASSHALQPRLTEKLPQHCLSPRMACTSVSCLQDPSPAAATTKCARLSALRVSREQRNMECSREAGTSAAEDSRSASRACRVGGQVASGRLCKPSSSAACALAAAAFCAASRSLASAVTCTQGCRPVQFLIFGYAGMGTASPHQTEDTCVQYVLHGAWCNSWRVVVVAFILNRMKCIADAQIMMSMSQARTLACRQWYTLTQPTTN